MVDPRGAVRHATDNAWFERAARAGFAISGILHLLIAYIALRLAFGMPSGSADQSGALATLASQRGGTALLWVGAAGLVALGLWRVAEAILGSHPGEKHTRASDRGGLGDRLQAGALAVVYAAMAVSAARFALGSGTSTSRENAGTSALLMQSGWGRMALVVVGVVVIVIGGYHVHKGATLTFIDDDLAVSPSRALTVTGISGYVAKGLVFIVVGVLVLVATLRTDPSKATGLDAAVKALGAAPYGKILLVLAAVGIAAFGAYSFVRSRYARM